MNLTSALLGSLGGLLIGYGLSRLRHQYPDGWGFAFLGVVALSLGLTHGLWGV